MLENREVSNPAVLAKFGLKQETGVGCRLPGPCSACCPEWGCWWEDRQRWSGVLRNTLVINNLGGTSCPPLLTVAAVLLDPVLPWHQAPLRFSSRVSCVSTAKFCCPRATQLPVTQCS